MAANPFQFESESESESESNSETTEEISDTKTGEFFKVSKRGRGYVKHAVLKHYLGAFFPIMAQTRWINQVIYVDGFAGPGMHQNGDKGSPLIAYETVVNHKLRHNFKAQIKMIFVEANEKHACNLQENLNAAQKAEGKATSVTFEVYCITFEEKLREILEIHGESPGTAMLVFADPFGYKGVPMDLMQALVNRSITEVFINVMYGAAIRWFKSRKCQKPLSEWIGLEESEWKSIVFDKANNTSILRRQSFMDLYIRQLTKKSENRLHLKFAMKDNRNRFIYNLIFITGHIKGLKEMKTAMSKYSQSAEEFVFSEWFEDSVGVEPKNMNKEKIVEDLVYRISNKFSKKQVLGKDVENYIWLETPYAFNVKNELKKALKIYWFGSSAGNQPRKNLAFDKILFNFLINAEPHLNEV